MELRDRLLKVIASFVACASHGRNLCQSNGQDPESWLRALRADGICGFKRSVGPCVEFPAELEAQGVLSAYCKVAL